MNLPCRRNVQRGQVLPVGFFTLAIDETIGTRHNDARG